MSACLSVYDTGRVGVPDGATCLPDLDPHPPLLFLFLSLHSGPAGPESVAAGLLSGGGGGQAEAGMDRQDALREHRTLGVVPPP